MDDPGPDGDQLRALFAAMANPIRSRLLFAISDHRVKIGDDPGLSVRQLADSLGEPKRRVRYHVDKMADQGLISIAAERTRRGVVERYYRVDHIPMVSNEQALTVPDDQGQKMAVHVLRKIVTDATAAVGAGIFGTRPGHTEMRLPGEVDVRGWKELAGVQERVYREFLDVILRAEERLKDSAADPIPIVSVLLLFDMPRRR